MKERENLLVSACLLGVNCRYDGANNKREDVLALMEKYNLIPVCPEQLGGLATPREAAEKAGGEKEERVLTRSGNDVSACFKRGAQETLKLAGLYGCKQAVLKERSPSCGCEMIYDGTFSGNVIEGKGVTAMLLEQNGIAVTGESAACRIGKPAGPSNHKKGEDKRMKTAITRQQALELLKKYNKEPFHLLHGFTVEGVMRWYAREMGYGEEAEFWGIAGLLHDVDFECFPEEHCQKAPELLSEIQAEDALVHAVCSHGYGLCSQVEPEHEMEKILYAADELTGLIGAAVRMRPSKSAMDLELSSLKKKYKDKRFAAGCSREVINLGAERLGWTLDQLLEQTILAMRSCEEAVNGEMELVETGA